MLNREMYALLINADELFRQIEFPIRLARLFQRFGHIILLLDNAHSNVTRTILGILVQTHVMQIQRLSHVLPQNLQIPFGIQYLLTLKPGMV